jgi:hypothetical protein
MDFSNFGLRFTSSLNNLEMEFPFNINNACASLRDVV